MVTPEMCATTRPEHPTLITGLAAALTRRTVLAELEGLRATVQCPRSKQESLAAKSIPTRSMDSS